jgi:saccharopine dehydrogenase (NADP+, L-glutamate forming)
MQKTLTPTLKLLGDPYRYSVMASSVGVIRVIATQLLMNRYPAVSKLDAQISYTKQTCVFIRDLVDKEGVNMVAQ